VSAPDNGPFTDLDTYAADARAFLNAHAVRRDAGPETAGPHSDLIPIFSHEATGTDPAAELAAARKWRATLADHGYAWIDGPAEYGGSGLTAAHAACFAAVEAGYLTPPQDIFMVGMRIVGPTILAFGSDELRARYLPGLYRGEILACQLFSEPGAGSDLPGLRTRAVRTGDYWLVDGAKVWTSEAQLCDIGLLLARTDPGQPRHRGLTLFVVDMRDPAIDIRPLRQMNGSEHFNEVFLNGVRVPDRFRVGEPGAGWRATVSTLNNERAATGDRASADQNLVTRLLRLAGERGAGEHGASIQVLRDLVGRAVISARALDYTNKRFAAEYAGVGGAAARNSLLKLARNRMLAELTEAAGYLLGDAAVTDTGEWGTYAWGRAMLSLPGQRIAGGTDEIQKNILGERVLGLPPEPRAS
jgi:alkylation response protein AidB-like acyl-CoA dehydrogenase